MNKIKFLNKKTDGLTLIETVLALLVIGISAITILSLQTVLSRGVFSSHAILERIYYINNLFVQADKEKLYDNEKPYEKKIDDPSLTLTYKTKKFGKIKSYSFDNIIVEQVEAGWQDIFGMRKENIITFRFLTRIQK